ncbi:MAG: alanine--tRNA ligase-related protein, partial [Thermodesulfobacteriota bacterium]
MSISSVALVLPELIATKPETTIYLQCFSTISQNLMQNSSNIFLSDTPLILNNKEVYIINLSSGNQESLKATYSYKRRMTEGLWLKDCYITEFEAEVIDVLGKYIMLDKTAFYPEGGGQPTDKGILTCGGITYNVLYVNKVGND